MELIRHLEPFWQGYLYGAALVMVLLLPVKALDTWEIYSLRKQIPSVSATEPR